MKHQPQLAQIVKSLTIAAPWPPFLLRTSRAKRRYRPYPPRESERTRVTSTRKSKAGKRAPIRKAVRLWIILVLLAIAGWLLFDWYRSDRSRTIPLVLISCLIVPMGWFEWRWQQTENSANIGAAVIAGPESPGVHCQRLSETLFYARSAVGWVGMDGDGDPGQALLTYDICTSLRAWLNSDKEAPSREEILAVHIVAHEAAHLAGIWDESMAECVSMRDGVSVAVAMGATLKQAEELVARYRDEIYPTLRSEYTRPTEC